MSSPTSSEGESTFDCNIVRTQHTQTQCALQAAVRALELITLTTHGLNFCALSPLSLLSRQCLCPPVEAVLTPCGHIHCWKCLYQWMDSGQPGANECPVCRSGISRANVIPIYGRGGGGGSRRRQASAAASSSAGHDGHAAHGDGAGPEGAAASAAAAGAGSAAASDSSASPSESSSSGIAQRRSAPYSWAPSAGGSDSSSSSSSSSSIPRRPAAQRVNPPPRAEAGAGWGGGWGGLHFAPLFGGGVIYAGGGAFSVGFGLIPALMGLLFQSARGQQPHAPPGHPARDQPGQAAAHDQSAAFGNAMLILGIFFILMIIYS